jgi:hypothetical protein
LESINLPFRRDFGLKALIFLGSVNSSIDITADSIAGQYWETHQGQENAQHDTLSPHYPTMQASLIMDQSRIHSTWEKQFENLYKTKHTSNTSNTNTNWLWPQ